MQANRSKYPYRQRKGLASSRIVMSLISSNNVSIVLGEHVRHDMAD